MSAPPPPLPGGPPPLPIPSLPPPGGASMPPPMMAPPMRGGRSPFTNTLIITNMPTFFVGYQQVRDWLYPCGTAKTCLFYPRPPKRKKDDENDVDMTPPKETETKKKTVLVNMLNPDQALKVVASFSEFAGQLDERYQDMRCYMVPSSPDIPLPPPLLDETSKSVLGKKLWNNFVSLETAHSEQGDNDDTASPAKSAPTSTPTDNTAQDSKLDADKVAAAAGGAYDADEDPLNAPQVLEAVKEFRRKLDKTQGSQKTQRMELVAKKLQSMRPKIRAQVQAEKERRKASAAAPPVMGLPPPPPPPAAAASADSGKRGRSNLPAWMTQQQQQQPPPTDEPSAKKQKTDYPSHFPSTLPQASHAVLRQFLANQVKESMGEEEQTLIDFLYTHILQGKATSELLQELQVVLEEEADGFLKAVWAKVQELQS